MRIALALAASAACIAMLPASATAATVQLESIDADGPNHVFTYGGTLAPTEGVTSGSKLVIFDFAGYIEDSIFSPYATIIGSTEMTTSGVLMDPSFTDDPNLANLVFTYVGADFHVEPAPLDTPYFPIDFTGLSAESSFGSTSMDGFAALTIKNESADGTLVYSAGAVFVPAPVPEPVTWGMMILGLSAVGISMRRGRVRRPAFS